MINEVINAVCKAIKNKYADLDIYTEAVEQGLRIPCFFVYCKGYSDELYRGKRYKVRVDIAVEYIPTEKDTNKNTNAVLENLFEITEYIECSDDICTLRGVDRKVENTENGAVLIIGYEYFYYNNENSEDMEELEIDENVKG